MGEIGLSEAVRRLFGFLKEENFTDKLADFLSSRLAR